MNLIRVVVSTVLLLLLLLTIPSDPVQAGTLSGWDADQRCEVTINGSIIESELTDFPLHLSLNSASGVNSTDMTPIFDELGSESLKIAVTTSDGETECYVEVVKWDSDNETANLIVKVPTVASGDNTTLYLYYDADHADNTAHVGIPDSAVAQNVWDSGFSSVHHLTEVSDGTSEEFKDSTSNGIDGQGGGGDSDNITTRIDGPFGYGQYGDGVSDYVKLPDNDLYSQNTTGTGNITISFWMNPHVLTWEDPEIDPPDGYVHVMGKGNSAVNMEYQAVFYPSGWPEQYAKNFFTFYVYNPSGGQGCGASTEEPHTGYETFTAADTWYYVELWADGNYNHMDVNDGYTETTANYKDWGGDPITMQNGDAPLLFLTHWCELYLNGSVAEIRISNVIRNEAWRAADYYSGLDQLVNFGAPPAASGYNFPIKPFSKSNLARYFGMLVSALGGVFGM